MNPIRFTFFPSSWRNNPYLDLLQVALERQGSIFIAPESDYLTWRWLLHRRGQIDVLHFHWIHYHYAFGRRPTFDLLRFVGKLLLARLLGYRLVWTLHNLLPHESEHPRLDWWARWCMAHIVHIVIVHCQEARQQLAKHFKRKRGVFGAVHGNYLQMLDHMLDKQTARQQLKVDMEALVFILFGGIRRYKGIEELINTFTCWEEANIRLIIAGRPSEPELAHLFTMWAERDGRIITHLEFMDNLTLQLYLSASDVAVLPFKQTLTSGSIIMALSASLPVVAPAMGCLPELVTPACGILYDPQQPNGLVQAMQQICTSDLPAMGLAARRRASEFSWTDAAQSTLQAYGQA